MESPTTTISGFVFICFSRSKRRLAEFSWPLIFFSARDREALSDYHTGLMETTTHPHRAPCMATENIYRVFNYFFLSIHSVEVLSNYYQTHNTTWGIIHTSTMDAYREWVFVREYCPVQSPTGGKDSLPASPVSRPSFLPHPVRQNTRSRRGQIGFRRLPFSPAYDLWQSPKHISNWLL